MKNDQTPITFEEAWEKIMNNRPQYKKDLDTPVSTVALREHTYGYVAQKLRDEGETHPVLGSNMDNEIEPKLVTKPFSEWERLCFGAGLERAQETKEIN